ncbi:MAG: OmpA family protein [Schleiferiaceae bacterium]|nr:OmpA family protein [Schleiferiaceae bacterium]
MKKHLFLLLAVLSLQGFSQLSPVLEVGGGLALKHTEGFYIPRLTVAGLNLYKGIGLYSTYEQRNNVVFVDDFNGDGDYQRYLIGPTLTINQSLYAFAGMSPLGPYGLNGVGGFGKVRKEIGLGLVFNPITLRLGYSNWVGTTLGVAYRFGSDASSVSFKGASKRRVRTSKPSALPEKEIIRIVDTVIVTETIEKEIIKEVIKEVVKPAELELLGNFYFEFNSTTIGSSATQLDELVALIQNNPKESFILIGHADEVGTENYNYNLGLKRAQKIAVLLVTKYGISSGQVEVRSLGETEPDAEDPNNSRRVGVYIRK